MEAIEFGAILEPLEIDVAADGKGPHGPFVDDLGLRLFGISVLRQGLVAVLACGAS